MKFVPRIADRELDHALGRAGAVLIEGPKACGKTVTTSRRAASIVHLDVDPSVPGQVAVDPSLVLEGARPRLLDDWQLHPVVWNAVRRAADSADTVDSAAAGLRAFADNVDSERAVLTVVTGTGPSYRRADGVNVVAIGALGP